MSFFSELKRRNVIRMAGLYVVGAWLSLQVTELLVDILDVPDWTMRFVLLLLLLGFPFALVFSWVYEMTPEGLKKERDVAIDASGTHNTARKLDVVVIFLLLAVLVVFAVDRLLPERAPDIVDQNEQISTASNDEELSAAERDGASIAVNSVAVLPFIDLSPAGDSEYFSDGLTETLLHMLAQSNELKVAARTSSFAFKGKTADVRDIALQLGVANILEGSVQRAGDQVRITAQLIRADDGFHVWSGIFDRKLESIFDIQDEIAIKVSNALNASLRSEAGANTPVGVSTNSVEAFDFYLLALSEYQKASVVSLTAAEELLDQAIRLDPQFVEAIALLARVQMWQTETGMFDTVEGLSIARATAEKVLAIDQNNVDALVIFHEAGERIQIAKGDLSGVAKGEDTIKRLIAENPSEVAPKVSYAGFLESERRFEEAVLQLDEAIELDPLNAELHYRKGNILRRGLNELTEARIAYRESLRLEPAQPNLYSALARMDQNSGDLVGFVQNVEIAAELDPADPELPAQIADTLCSARLPDLAQPYVEQALKIAPENDFVSNVEVGCVFSSGDYARTIRMARKLIEADISDRRGSFSSTVGLMLVSHHYLDTVDEGVAYLEERYPGFRVAAETLPLKIRIASAFSSPIFTANQNRAEKDAAAERLLDLVETWGQPIEEARVPRLFYFGLSGQYDELVDYMVADFFPDFVNQSPDFANRIIFELPLFEPVAKRPEIVAGFDDWNRSFDRTRQKLIVFFEERQQ
ncbi:MAG: tetratricopeptide repeat protein [Woeseiaceae bacterium]